MRDAVVALLKEFIRREAREVKCSGRTDETQGLSVLRIEVARDPVAPLIGETETRALLLGSLTAFQLASIWVRSSDSEVLSIVVAGGVVVAQEQLREGAEFAEGRARVGAALGLDDGEQSVLQMMQSVTHGSLVLEGQCSAARMLLTGGDITFPKYSPTVDKRTSLVPSDRSVRAWMQVCLALPPAVPLRLVVHGDQVRPTYAALSLDHLHRDSFTSRTYPTAAMYIGVCAMPSAAGVLLYLENVLEGEFLLQDTLKAACTQVVVPLTSDAFLKPAQAAAVAAASTPLKTLPGLREIFKSSQLRKKVMISAREFSQALELSKEQKLPITKAQRYALCSACHTLGTVDPNEIVGDVWTHESDCSSAALSASVLLSVAPPMREMRALIKAAKPAASPKTPGSGSADKKRKGSPSALAPTASSKAKTKSKARSCVNCQKPQPTRACFVCLQQYCIKCCVPMTQGPCCCGCFAATGTERAMALAKSSTMALEQLLELVLPRYKEVFQGGYTPQDWAEMDVEAAADLLNQGPLRKAIRRVVEHVYGGKVDASEGQVEDLFVSFVRDALNKK